MTQSPLWLLLFLIVPIPFGTNRRRRSQPYVTYTLIAINVLIYCFTANRPEVLHQWGLVPDAPKFAALFTGPFLHVNFYHLFWNMLFLWLFGPDVEDALGPAAFIALYIGGAIAAGLLHMALTVLMVSRELGPLAESPLVGASGAISAILAPLVARFYRAQIRLFWAPGLLMKGSWSVLELPAIWGLGLWLLQTLAGAIKAVIQPDTGGTAYWAHLGGFVFGLVAAQLTGLWREGHRDYLLEDARGAADLGQNLLAEAIARYRKFLEFDPDNAGVHAELARALAQSATPNSDEHREASAEMQCAITFFERGGQFDEAARCYADAHALGILLAISPRERLRLATAAEECGDAPTATVLLRLLIAETPEAHEDEMARLKLGQLLVSTEPQQARKILISFVEKYPESTWIKRIRELLKQTYTT